MLEKCVIRCQVDTKQQGCNACMDLLTPWLAPSKQKLMWIAPDMRYFDKNDPQRLEINC